MAAAAAGLPVDRAYRAQLHDLSRSCQHAALAYAEPRQAARLAARLDPRLVLLRAYDASGCSLGGRGGDGGGLRLRCPDAQAYLLRRGADLVLSFRGTLNANDVADAVDIRHARLDVAQASARVHRGFYHQFRAIEPHITRDLLRHATAPARVGTRTRRLVLTGHSMGAGLAIIAAAHYGASPRGPLPPLACHAFGPPLMGDAALARAFMAHVASHWVVHMADDVVPRIPVHPEFCYMPRTLELPAPCAGGTASTAPACLLGPRSSYSAVCLLAHLLRLGGVDEVLRHHSCESYLLALQVAQHGGVPRGGVPRGGVPPPHPPR